MLLNRFFAPIATAVFLSAPAAVYAQTPPWALPSATERYARADDAQVSYYDARRIAYDQGYREGVKEGEKDARRGDRYCVSGRAGVPARAIADTTATSATASATVRRSATATRADTRTLTTATRVTAGTPAPTACSPARDLTRSAVRPGSLRPARTVRRLRRFLRLLQQPGIRQRCARGLREGTGGCAQGAKLRRPASSIGTATAIGTTRAVTAPARSTKTSIAADSSRDTSRGTATWRYRGSDSGQAQESLHAREECRGGLGDGRIPRGRPRAVELGPPRNRQDSPTCSMACGLPTPRRRNSSAVQLENDHFAPRHDRR